MLDFLNELALELDGSIDAIREMTDGSGFATMSLLLPKNHWLTLPGENIPPMPFRMGTLNPNRALWVERLQQVGRYAIRCATCNGNIIDFDPDALVQSLIVGMLGYFTPDGLSSEKDIVSDDSPP